MSLEEELKIEIENDVCHLDEFIEMKLRNIFTRKKIRKQLVELLPIIIENTNFINMKWLSLERFVNDVDCINTLIDNLEKFHFDGNNDKLYSKIIHFLWRVNLTDEDIRKIYIKLLESNYNFNDFRVESLINHIAENNVELQSEILNCYIKHEPICYSCINYCLDNQNHQNIIYENIDVILNNKNIDLFYLKQLINNKYIDSKKEELINVIKKKLQENSKVNVKKMIINLYSSIPQINPYLHEINDVDNKKLDSILDIITLLVEDISKNENINISDINIIGSGDYSYVIELGNKILKVGRKRGIKTFPNNPYIIAPILRKEFIINDKLSLFVEVTEKADTKSYISEEELYQLYKNIRNLGLYWEDVNLGNVGRLLKDNVIYWREELPITDERLGLTSHKEKMILKKGELVIIDNDYISENKIPGRKQSKMEMEFEMRYQEELNKKNNLVDRYNEIIENELDDAEDLLSNLRKR